MIQDVKKLYTLICILLIIPILYGCKSTEETKVGMAMDTIVSITIYDGVCDKKAVIDQCFNMITRYDDMFSAYKNASDIYAINASNGKAINVSDETIDLLNKGIEYSKLSGGIFDITGGALIDLWHINGDASENEIPSDEAILLAKEGIGYDNIEINGNSVKLNNPNTRVNLGGIAKGYVADRLREYMLSAGVKSAMINLGGNVVTIGNKNGQPFNIGIPRPFDTNNICHSVKITDKSVVTSGNYQRYFKKDGVIYHHILNYDTGYPSDSGLSSVSIICDSSVEADALSTTCFILGYDKSIEYLSNMKEDISAVFILDNDEVITWN